MAERIIFAIAGGLAVYCFMTFSNKFVCALFVIAILAGAIMCDYFTREKIHNGEGEEEDE